MKSNIAYDRVCLENENNFFKRKEITINLFKADKPAGETRRWSAVCSTVEKLYVTTNRFRRIWTQSLSDLLT